MKGKIRFLGLDVRTETIAVAVAGPDGEVRRMVLPPADIPGQDTHLSPGRPAIP